MTKNRLRPKLKFDNVDAAITDIESLRQHGYVKAGQWSLPQVCFHLSQVVDSLTQPTTATECTPEQKAFKEKLQSIIAQPGGPSNLDAPPGSVPTPTADESAVDAAINSLRKVAGWPEKIVGMGGFGPAPLAEALHFHLSHFAHHLSFLQPKAKRREGLRYNTITDAINDIHNLRERGYRQAGNWTLEQNCWHLDVVTKTRLKPGPFPPNTPEQDAKKDMFAQVLATGQLPPGLESPDEFVPPSDADATAVTAFLETLEKVKTHVGPFAPHRRFGHMSDDDSRKQILIHTAHHLSHLVPNE